tara:strand:+ start:446 stop:1390 length:945 start_codon:yes stop_codon:yes gene_type:complete
MIKFFKFFLIYVFLALFCGCEKKELKNQIVVLQYEVDELESDLDNLQGENKNLKGRLAEIKKLEKELKLLRAKMDSVAQLPGTLYSQAHDYFELENYDACMDLLVLLSEKYPDWDRKKVEKKYDDAYRKKREFQKEQLRLKKIDERKQKRAAQMLDSIKNNVESVFDSKSGKTYYKTLRSTLCQVAHTISFGIELYLVVDKEGNREFRIRSTYIDKSGSDYHDPQWMNYNEIELLTDNNKRIFVNVDVGKKELIESTFINQEKSDDIIDTDKILNFFDANRIRVYFKGKYLYEFDMTYEQFNAFREILANYDYI